MTAPCENDNNLHDFEEVYYDADDEESTFDIEYIEYLYNIGYDFDIYRQFVCVRCGLRFCYINSGLFPIFFELED